MGARFRVTGVPLKIAPPPLSSIKKFFDYPGHLFGVPSSRRLLAAASHLDMFLNVAVMAQRTQVLYVIHEAVFLGIGYAVLYWSPVVYLGRWCYISLCLAPLA